MEGVGKPRAWGGGNRRDIARKQNRLQCNHFKHRHVKKKMPVEHPSGVSSHAYSGELACLGASEMPLH